MVDVEELTEEELLEQYGMILRELEQRQITIPLCDPSYCRHGY